jgi:hypothetical protein
MIDSKFQDSSQRSLREASTKGQFRRMAVKAMMHPVVPISAFLFHFYVIALYLRDPFSK